MIGTPVPRRPAATRMVFGKSPTSMTIRICGRRTTGSPTDLLTYQNQPTTVKQQIMSEKERNEILEKITRGLQLANENMLRAKKARGEKVVYARPNGKIYTIKASTALKKYLANKQANS